MILRIIFFSFSEPGIVVLYQVIFLAFHHEHRRGVIFLIPLIKDIPLNRANHKHIVSTSPSYEIALYKLLKHLLLLFIAINIRVLDLIFRFRRDVSLTRFKTYPYSRPRVERAYHKVLLIMIAFNADLAFPYQIYQTS